MSKSSTLKEGSTAKVTPIGSIVMDEFLPLNPLKETKPHDQNKIMTDVAPMSKRNDSHIFAKELSGKERIKILMVNSLYPFIVASVFYIFTGLGLKWLDFRCFGLYAETENENCESRHMVFLIFYTILGASVPFILLEYLLVRRTVPLKDRIIIMGCYTLASIISIAIYMSSIMPAEISVRSRMLSIVVWMGFALNSCAFTYLLILKNKEIFIIHKPFIFHEIAFVIEYGVISVFFIFSGKIYSIFGSSGQTVLLYTIQPIVDLVFKLITWIMVRPNPIVPNEDLILLIRLADAIGSAIKLSFWLTMEITTGNFWYNVTLFLMGEVDTTTKVFSTFLARKCKKYRYLSKIFKEKEIDEIAKMRNGNMPSKFLIILILFILRGLNIPTFYESVLYNFESYTYGVVDKVDFRSIMSYERLGIALIISLVANALSILINKHTGYDTIKIKSSYSGRKIDFFILCSHFIIEFGTFSFALDIGMFATQNSTRYWDFYRIFG